MGVTRLKRKARRNKQTAAKRKNSIQQLNRKPVIKNIDKEAIKASFGTAPAKEEAPVPAVEETTEKVVAEAPAAVKEETLVAEADTKVEEAVSEASEAVESAMEASEEAVETAEEQEKESAEEDKGNNKEA